MKIEVNNSLFQDIVTGELTPPRVLRLWNWKVQNGGFGSAILDDYESLSEFDLLQNTTENIRNILKRHGKDAVVSLTNGVFDNYRSTDALIYQTTDDDGGLRINSIEEGGIMWNAMLQLLARSYADDDDYDIALIMDGKESG